MTAPAPTVLLVEDEKPIRNFLRSALSAHGYRVVEAETLAAARVQVTSQPPDVVLLDLGLPDGDGIELVREVRQWSALPIVVLSARGQEGDKVLALDAGADDYLTKPFGVPELLARLRVALRHHQRGEEPAPVWRWSSATSHTLAVDAGARVCTVQAPGGEPVAVKLTPTEWKLLLCLARHHGKLLTHAMLLREVWGPAHEHDVAYLRVYTGQLRQKLEPEPARPQWLLTEPGVGYRMVSADEA